MRNCCSVLLAALLVLGGCGNVSTGSPYILGHDRENFQIALYEVCLRYLDNGPWPPRGGFIGGPKRGVFVGLQEVFWVGGGSIAAGVGDRGDGRECVVQAESGDPQVYAAALREHFNARGLPITEAPAPPGEPGLSHTWCSTNGPYLVMFERLGGFDGTPPIFVKLQFAETRPEICDADAS